MTTDPAVTPRYVPPNHASSSFPSASRRPRAYLLASDAYSPNSEPHALPAIHWPRGLLPLLEAPTSHASASTSDGQGGEQQQQQQQEAVEEEQEEQQRQQRRVSNHLAQRGWQTRWRYTMYARPHYHTTTHELLTVVSRASALVQLGSPDPKARPRPRPPPSPPPLPPPPAGDTTDDRLAAASASTTTTTVTLRLERGDVLLLPAGDTHAAVETQVGFALLGAYPEGADDWDMRFPNVMGCPYDVRAIRELCFGPRPHGEGSGCEERETRGTGGGAGRRATGADVAVGRRVGPLHGIRLGLGTDAEDPCVAVSTDEDALQTWWFRGGVKGPNSTPVA